MQNGHGQVGDGLSGCDDENMLCGDNLATTSDVCVCVCVKERERE